MDLGKWNGNEMRLEREFNVEEERKEGGKRRDGTLGMGKGRNSLEKLISKGQTSGIKEGISEKRRAKGDKKRRPKNQ